MRAIHGYAYKLAATLLNRFSMLSIIKPKFIKHSTETMHVRRIYNHVHPHH